MAKLHANYEISTTRALIAHVDRTQVAFLTARFSAESLRNTVAVLDSTGVPLGWFAECEFSTRTLQIEAGQLVVLSTDGATETSVAGDVEFGSDGVLEYVRHHLHDSSRDIAEGIHQAARSFARGGPQTDDVTPS